MRFVNRYGYDGLFGAGFAYEWNKSRVVMQI